eukprot:3559215-Pleurochrysis_carterae.AAC.1
MINLLAAVLDVVRGSCFYEVRSRSRITTHKLRAKPRMPHDTWGDFELDYFSEKRFARFDSRVKSLGILQVLVCSTTKAGAIEVVKQNSSVVKTGIKYRLSTTDSCSVCESPGVYIYTYNRAHNVRKACCRASKPDTLVVVLTKQEARKKQAPVLSASATIRLAGGLTTLR